MNKKITVISWVLRFLGIVLLIGLMYWVIDYTSSPHGSVQPMDIIFVPTEDDADCAILINRDRAVVIDTGEAEDYPFIAKVLQQYGIGHIDCLILTHPDKDHIGSALEILQNYTVDLVVQPYYGLENDRYEELNDWLETEGIPCLIPTRERNLVFGDMRLKIYPPEKFSYDNDNNYSLAVSIEHGRTSMFFAGDAMRKRTEELLELSIQNVDLYKMSYHGRNYTGSAQLLEKLNPKFVIVTARQADAELEPALQGRNVFYTVGSGAAFYSDGSQIREKEKGA